MRGQDPKESHKFDVNADSDIYKHSLKSACSWKGRPGGLSLAACE